MFAAYLNPTTPETSSFLVAQDYLIQVRFCVLNRRSQNKSKESSFLSLDNVLMTS